LCYFGSPEEGQTEKTFADIDHDAAVMPHVVAKAGSAPLICLTTVYASNGSAA
jgi:hypothetical protein